MKEEEEKEVEKHCNSRGEKSANGLMIVGKRTQSQGYLGHLNHFCLKIHNSETLDWEIQVYLMAFFDLPRRRRRRAGKDERGTIASVVVVAVKQEKERNQSPF